jgi:hypothetical protein
VLLPPGRLPEALSIYDSRRSCLMDLVTYSSIRVDVGPCGDNGSSEAAEAKRFSAPAPLILFASNGCQTDGARFIASIVLSFPSFRRGTHVGLARNPVYDID